MSAIVPNQSIPNNPFGIDGTLYLDNALNQTVSLANSANTIANSANTSATNATNISNNILTKSINISTYNIPSNGLNVMFANGSWTYYYGAYYYRYTDAAVSDASGGYVYLYCSDLGYNSDLYKILYLGSQGSLNNGNGFNVFSNGVFPIPSFTNANSTQCTTTINTGTLTNTLPIWTPSGQPTNSCIQGINFDFVFYDYNHLFESITINVGDVFKYPNTPSTVFLFGQLNFSGINSPWIQIGNPKTLNFLTQSTITMSFSESQSFYSAYRIVLPTITSTTSGICYINYIQLSNDIANISYNQSSYLKFATRKEAQTIYNIGNLSTTDVNIGNSSNKLSLHYSSLYFNGIPQYLIFNLSPSDTSVVSTSDQYTFVPPFGFNIEYTYVPHWWVSSKDTSQNVVCDILVNGSSIFDTGPLHGLPTIYSNNYYSIMNPGAVPFPNPNPFNINAYDVVVFKVSSYTGSTAKGLKVILFMV